MNAALSLPGFENAPETAPERAEAPEAAPASRWRVELYAAGLPATKGSARPFTIRRRDGRVGAGVAHGTKSQEKRLQVWENAVRTAAMMALGELDITRRPVSVLVVFRMPRPGGHFGSGKNADKLKASAPAFPAGTPDVDKILRSTLDGMTGMLYADDSQVVHVDVWKRFADARNPIGASIVVEEL